MRVRQDFPLSPANMPFNYLAGYTKGIAMQISVEDLRAVTDILFERLETLEIQCVDLSADYYWTVPPEEAYDTRAEPRDLDLGCLAADWKALHTVMTGGDEPLPFHFVHLASLLRAVGEARLD